MNLALSLAVSIAVTAFLTGYHGFDFFSAMGTIAVVVLIVVIARKFILARAETVHARMLGGKIYD